MHTYIQKKLIRIHVQGCVYMRFHMLLMFAISEVTLFSYIQPICEIYSDQKGFTLLLMIILV